MTKCPECGGENPDGKKFCGDCGVRLLEPVVMKFYGDATFINQDESRKVNRCSVCGRHLVNSEGFTCRSCSMTVCPSHFVLEKKCCTECAEKDSLLKVRTYREKVAEVSGDGIIDLEGRRKLRTLALQLGLDSLTVERIEGEERGRISGHSDDFTRIERIGLENAKNLLFESLDYAGAAEKLCAVYENHRDCEEVLELYLRALKNVDLEKAYSIASGLAFTFPEAEAVKARYFTWKGDYSRAERILVSAKAHFGCGGSLLVAECAYLESLFSVTKDPSVKSDLDSLKKVIEAENDPFLLDELHLGKTGGVRYEEGDVIPPKVMGGKTVACTEEIVVCAREVPASGNGAASVMPFAVGKYAVTQDFYETVTGRNPSYFTPEKHNRAAPGEDSKKRPVELVTWFDALWFCNRLTEMLMGESECVYSIRGIETGSEGEIVAADVVADFTRKGWRLPTEAEWVMAAGSAGGTGKSAWTMDNSGEMTHQSGLKEANALGIHDMWGNVWEWCWDRYPSGKERILRGGSCLRPAEFCGPSRRSVCIPDCCADDNGFRLARSL